jgi:hypothetical protein
MGDDRPVAAFAIRKRRQKLCDPFPEINGQRQDRAQLDDDGKHLPVTIVEGNTQERLANAQVRGGTDRKELCQSLNNSKDERENIWVHGDASSLSACERRGESWEQPDLRRK